jgi:hypothetical protein
MSMRRHRYCFPSLIALATLASSVQAKQLVVSNNHDVAYAGPLDLAVPLLDGHYAGPNASGDVRNGSAHVVVSLAPGAQVTLARRGAAEGNPVARGPLAVTPNGSSLGLRWRTTSLGDVALGLAVIPGTTATSEDAVRAFTPLSLSWTKSSDGALHATAERDGHTVAVIARPYRDGYVDVSARLVRGGGSGAPAYLALVRRVVTPAVRDARMRWNGREMTGAVSPNSWDRDFWYVRGLDWLGWRSGSVSLLSVNRFTPVPTIRKDSVWKEGSHFYVWERSRQKGDTLYLVSEIAGPNSDQAKSRYMPVTPYAPLGLGDTVSLGWRLAISSAPGTNWAESQLRVFAGTRAITGDARSARVELGVPYTTFGVAYFPYSTLTENLDYYRVPGLSSEAFWPVSPVMWTQWRKFEPRMRADLRIVRAMGFDVVRLHHLELLRTMERDEAFAFLDFFTGEARGLGLTLMLDTQGPSEWVTAVLTRYRDIVTRVELENEVLIDGIKPADPARWKALYAASKRAAPDAQVLFTGAGNNAMFERLRALGVPFDRVGLHAYKHGPQWPEAYGSHVLGTAGYAASIGRQMTIGEFNWKDLTKLSPEARRAKFVEVYESVLAPRVVPELMQFQLQEQMAFNTTVAGSSSRHYEPIGLDRRPKPEAFETMRLIRKYGRPDAPVRTLPVVVDEARFTGGRAAPGFTIRNATSQPLTVTLSSASFDGTGARLLTPAQVTLAPGMTIRGRVELTLPAGALPGLYHHFIEAKASGGGLTSIGWGVVNNPGAPTFADSTVLGPRVSYAQGLNVVRDLKWDRPLAVVFGARASVLELEQAYQLANTLQSATGRPVRISSEVDLPDSLARNGTVFLVGTAASSERIASLALAIPAGQAGRGTITLNRNDGREWLVLTGSDPKGVEAAVVELEMRYWPNAKDAAMRLVGMEQGAALGKRTGGSSVELP